MAALRAGLLAEIVTMSIDTLRTNKMRSALTVLGVVIGITSIVGMTSLIRGFDDSLRDSISQLGPNTIFVQKMGRAQLRVGQELPRGRAAAEPDERRRARDRARVPVGRRSSTSGSARWAATAQSRIYYGNERTKPLDDPRRDRELGGGQLRASSKWGASSCPREVDHRRQVVVLGQTPLAVAVPEHRSDRQEGADRRQRVHRHRRAGQAAEPGRLLDGRRRLRGHSVHARTRSSTARSLKGSAKMSAQQFQPGGVPDGDDRRRAARGMRDAGDARGRGADAHPPQAEARTSRTTSTSSRRTRS